MSEQRTNRAGDIGLRAAMERMQERTEFVLPSQARLNPNGIWVVVDGQYMPVGKLTYKQGREYFEGITSQ